METTNTGNSIWETIRKIMVRPNWAGIYTSTVPVVGLIVTLYTFFHLPNNLAGLSLFIILGVIAELTSIELFSRSTISMSSIIAIASIVAFGPLAGVLTYLASGLTTAITTTLLKNKSARERASLFQRTSFNSGMWVIAGLTAGQAYVLVGGIPGDVVQWSSIPALAVATGVEWLVNAVILMGVISLNSGKHPFEIWKQDIGWQAPVSVLSGVLGGGMLALAYSMFNLLGVLVVLLPILSTSYAFRLYKNNMKVYVEGLENLNSELKKALGALEVSNQELTDANRAVNRLNAELFQSLAEVFDMRDPYVGGHAAQVAKYAVAIATEMRLPAERIEMIRQSAFLHDIGKLAVPEAILHKPGKLTDIEYEFIKKHSDIGYELLNSTEGLKHLAPCVRYHHERWDGGGYPLGLTGEQIPLEARILNLCDSVESMASDRPYHRGMSVDEIVAEVQRCAGSQFDPMLVEVFNKLVQQHGSTFVVNSARSVTQQFAASLLANETLTHSMFAWVLEREAQKQTVNENA